ncbi:MAG TPA: hypothetical protein VGZ04_12095 [Acidimicrobiales bacterium]|nr:hypothetical protein [Acidimicrobiales bacterium]
MALIRRPERTADVRRDARLRAVPHFRVLETITTPLSLANFTHRTCTAEGRSVDENS